MTETPKGPPRRPQLEAPDIREKGGPKDGQPQVLDNRLFMQLQAFTGCKDIQALIQSLESAKIAGALYADMHDPEGVGLLTFSEDETHFVTAVRSLLSAQPFASLVRKPEYTMVGRTYALGYEPNLEDWLLRKPRRNVLNKEFPWAVWYPLRRKGEFVKLPEDEQKKILREHGTIGMAFGQAGMAHDIRLACHGIDTYDNDFVIGLIGKRLHPLSALVERMRRTTQTSTYMEKMGPFFVGKAVWQSS